MESVAKKLGSLNQSCLVWARRLINHLLFLDLGNDRVAYGKER